MKTIYYINYHKLVFLSTNKNLKKQWINKFRFNIVIKYILLL